MSRCLKCTLALLVAGSLSTSSASAAPVLFQGVVVDSPAANSVFTAGTLVTLALDVTPGPSFPAVIASAALTIGTESWNVLIGGSNQIGISAPNGTAPDDLTAQAAFGPSTAGGIGSVFAGLSLTISGSDDVGPAPAASAANLALLAKNGNLAVGSLDLVGAEVPGFVTTVNFSGTSVPEPGSMALLSGLGLVFGFGAWRRRRQAALQVTA